MVHISKKLASRCRMGKKRLGDLRRQAVADFGQAPRDMKPVQALVRSGHDPLQSAVVLAQHFTSLFAEAVSQVPAPMGGLVPVLQRHQVGGQFVRLGFFPRAVVEPPGERRVGELVGDPCLGFVIAGRLRHEVVGKDGPLGRGIGFEILGLDAARQPGST